MNTPRLASIARFEGLMICARCKMAGSIACLAVLCGTLIATCTPLIAGGGDSSGKTTEQFMANAAASLEKSTQEEGAVSSRRAYALILFAQKEYVKCSKICAEILQSTPNDIEIKILAARVWMEQRDSKGIQQLRKLVEDYPTNTVVLVNYVDALVRAHRDDEAGPIIEELVRVNPTLAFVYLRRAQVAFYKGDRAGTKESVLKYFDLVSLTEISDPSPHFKQALKLVGELSWAGSSGLATNTVSLKQQTVEPTQESLQRQTNHLNQP